MGRHSGFEVARVSAYATFGKRYWRWIVFGPVIARVVGTLLVAGGVALAGLWLLDHWPMIVAWVTMWVVPIVVTAVATAVVLVVSLVVWRMWGWWFNMYSVSLKMYALTIVTSSVMLGAFLIGVSL